MIKAEIILHEIFDELSGRGGIGDSLDQIADDAEVYKEMYDTCVNRIAVAIAFSHVATKERVEKIKKLKDRWSPDDPQ
jgi:hypothetical protein